MDNEPDTQHQELRGPAQARWDALKDVVGELVGGVDDADGFAAALAAMRQIGQGVDLQEILNAVHVPDDAGEYAEALRRMLVRIPDGWAGGSAARAAGMRSWSTSTNSSGRCSPDTSFIRSRRSTAACGSTGARASA
jgi:hypothetical protein